MTLFDEPLSVRVHHAITAAVNAEPPVFTLIVHGKPMPAGSKSAKPVKNKATGQLIRINMVDGRTDAAVAAHTSWREAVREEGQRLFTQMSPGYAPLDGPLQASLTITVPRPASLPKRRRNAAGILVEVRHFPITRPDALKYARSVEDSVTDSGLWTDDARVFLYTRLGKFYAGDGERYGEADVLSVPGIVLRVWRVEQ